MADPRLLSTVRDDLIRDYARLIDDGWCGPSEIDDRMVSRGEPDDEQRLWLIDLAALAAADGLGMAETGENVGGEFSI